MQKHPPEEAVTIVGALVAMVGVNALFRILTGEAIDLSVFGLWLGYDLLRGKKSARGVVLAFSVLGLLLVSLAGGFLIIQEMNRTGQIATRFFASLDSLEIAQPSPRNFCYLVCLGCWSM